MTTLQPAVQLSPASKGRIIGTLLILPLFLHAAFFRCFYKSTGTACQVLFVAGFLIAGILVVLALIKSPKARQPVPVWKAALGLLFFSSFAGAIVVGDGIGFARAAVFFTAKEPVSATATVISSGPSRGCRSHVELYDPALHAALGMCASDFGLAPRVGDRIVVERLVSPIGIYIVGLR